MFMMEFDLYQMIEDAMLVQQIIPVDYEINTKSIIFKINVSPLRVKTSHVGGVPREDGLL
jgi:hypothetical protein